MTSQSIVQNSTHQTKTRFLDLQNSISVLALVAAIAVPAFGESEGKGPREPHLPKSTAAQLGPSERYSGWTPVDMKNGLLFNNGTYGLPNADYEQFATEWTMPGMSAKAYTFQQKDTFVDALEERIIFFDAAVFNWKNLSEQTKPEARDYAKKALETIEPLIGQLRDAKSKAASASESKWSDAQADARRVLGQIRTAYMQMHKNVKM